MFKSYNFLIQKGGKEKMQNEDLIGFLEGYLFYCKDGMEIKKVCEIIDKPEKELIKVLKKISNKLEGLKISISNRNIKMEVDDFYKNLIKKYDYQTKEDRLKLAKKYIYSLEIKNYSKGTIYNYNLFIKKFINYIDKPFNLITSKDLNDFLMEIRDKRNLSKKTSVTTFFKLSSFFKWLFREEYINKNPMLKMTKPQSAKSKPKHFTVEEIETIREHEQNNNLLSKTIFEVLYSSGLRVSELVNLNWNDIDFNEGSVFVKNGKGNKDRISLISVKSIILLKKYRKIRKDNNEWIFQSNYKKRISRYSVYRRIKKMSERAGIKKRLTPHKLRHSFATHLLDGGAPRSVVQALLGHSDPKTTEVYAKISLENVKHFYKNANL